MHYPHKVSRIKRKRSIGFRALFRTDPKCIVIATHFDVRYRAVGKREDGR